MNLQKVKPTKAKQTESSVVDRFEEGAHCLMVKSEPNEGEKQYQITERRYPEVAGIELAHAFNYGNWRKMKSLTTKSTKGNSVTVWKCVDCGAKLQK